ncbi:type III-A CRISPR-associated CARF protein Csm6 [Streptococcus dentapri]|uniref:Type III-A CRISPR-associated protein Csm6 n=1 Tax=Streptococcus dentapri TaxID=573564 RepID=A0ABV8CZ79_9STRE
MKVLISAVGDTDPIRGSHDGPLLHISRYYRPDKIVLIFSEGMLHKEERLKAAILSIPNYHPEIEVESKLLLDDDVYRFDKMYEQLSEIISRYTSGDDEFLLNLSSSTPQIISAMFAINKINDLNIKAIQVPTPVKGSNRNNPDDSKDIKVLIEENYDNQDNHEVRIIEEKSEKFNQLLVKRNLRELIRKYDYQGAYNLMLQKENANLISKSKQKKMNSQLEKLTQSFKYQKYLDDLFARDHGKREGELKALNHFLLIDILNRRDMVADVLIKSKSLVEFILQDYIQQHYPNLIIEEDGRPTVDETHELAAKVNAFISEKFRLKLGDSYNPDRPYDIHSTLNIHSYMNIIDCLESNNSFVQYANPVLALNKMRNIVAHGLSEMDNNQVNRSKLKKAIKAMHDLLAEVYEIEEEQFRYFEEKNRELLNLLK